MSWLDVVQRLSDLEPSAVGVVREMFRAYGREVGDCRCFADFESELTSLPGPYAPPDGEILMARGKGVVALKRRAPGVAEIKRLYVVESARGTGLGRAIAEAAFAEAQRLGYRRVWLETLDQMAAAIRLYRSLGMREVEPEGAHGRSFELDL